jgi:hypothetical protein
MSSLAVRQIARQWVTSLSVPYYNTIGEEQNPQDAVWVSLEFDFFSYDKLSYCDQWVEEGIIRVAWFGAIGNGEEALVQVAETDAATIMAQVDPAGKVTIVGRSAPEVFRLDGPQLGVEISFNYQYSP